jgi:hypothetical protein
MLLRRAGDILRKLSVGVLGATGTIGQMFLSMLGSHPNFKVKCIAASKRSEGKRLRSLRVLYPVCDEFLAMPIQDVETARFDELDLVFSGLPSDVAGPVESRIAEVRPVSTKAREAGTRIRGAIRPAGLARNAGGKMRCRIESARPPIRHGPAAAGTHGSRRR